MAFGKSTARRIGRAIAHRAARFRKILGHALRFRPSLSKHTQQSQQVISTAVDHHDAAEAEHKQLLSKVAGLSTHSEVHQARKAALLEANSRLKEEQSTPCIIDEVAQQAEVQQQQQAASLNLFVIMDTLLHPDQAVTAEPSKAITSSPSSASSSCSSALASPSSDALSRAVRRMKEQQQLSRQWQGLTLVLEHQMADHRKAQAQATPSAAHHMVKRSPSVERFIIIEGLVNALVEVERRQYVALYVCA